ncbi:hypothetical protein F511_46833 [Dorcoceras hygrometricum]|uniref:Uncharacterized protein n=1 Tax=Dorcoceras hygrometricum TaxID=472368 RepID=A0A2Z6ZSL3_9LAMI|nr:hypothetical protein F511_46833 [Dorcoceras hygrometricum]
MKRATKLAIITRRSGERGAATLGRPMRNDVRAPARHCAISHSQCAASAHGSRARMCARREGGGRRMRRRPVVVLRNFDVSILKFIKLDTIMAIRIDQIRETMALIPLLGIRIRPPARQLKNKEI